MDPHDVIPIQTPVLETSLRSPTRSSLEEMMESHYFDKTFHFIEDLSSAEAFQRATLCEVGAGKIVKQAKAHYESNPPKFFEDIMKFLRSDLPSIFIRFNIMTLIIRLCSETARSKNHPFSECCSRIEESMIEIINLVVGTDSGDPPHKLPNPNVHTIKRVLEDAKKRKLFSESTIAHCEKRLEIVSKLPQSSSFMSSYENLRNSRIRNMVKDRMDMDREKLRKGREEYQLASLCDNWVKGAPEHTMKEFEIFWEFVKGPLMRYDTRIPRKKIHIFKG